MRRIKRLIAVIAAATLTASVAHASTIDLFEPVAGGEQTAITVGVNGFSISEFSAFGVPDFATVSISGTAGSVISLGFPTQETLTISSVEQEFSANAYNGLFSVIGGSDALDWGDWALVSIDLPSGVSFGVPGTMTITEVAPIPLPAGALLLVTGVFGLALFRRHRVA